MFHFSTNETEYAFKLILLTLNIVFFSFHFQKHQTQLCQYSPRIRVSYFDITTGIFGKAIRFSMLRIILK